MNRAFRRLRGHVNGPPFGSCACVAIMFSYSRSGQQQQQSMVTVTRITVMGTLKYGLMIMATVVRIFVVRL